MSPTKKRTAEEIAAVWNRHHPVGTPVTYWPGVREGAGRTSKTRSPAWVVCGNAVVSVDGYAGGIALTHMQAGEGSG